jgi:hypothetical protein
MGHVQSESASSSARPTVIVECNLGAGSGCPDPAAPRSAMFCGGPRSCGPIVKAGDSAGQGGGVVKRSGTRSTEVASLFTAAQQHLWLDFQEATTRQHQGKVGGLREDAIAQLLTQRLPKTYKTITRAEAVDRYDRHSRDLDVVTFDEIRNPVLSKEDLLPAEALLSVIEVKSTLTLGELQKAVNIARSVRELRPFGRQFIGVRPNGQAASDKRCRCFVTLFAFKSDLSQSTWLAHEWSRYLSVVGSANANLIDMIVVLDRGTLRPPNRTGKADPDGKSTLHHWFVSLANFLERENTRRPPMDWEIYLSRYGQGWAPLP